MLITVRLAVLLEEVPTPIRLGKAAREEQKCPEEWHLHLHIGNLNIAPFSRGNLANLLQSSGENRGFVELVANGADVGG